MELVKPPADIESLATRYIEFAATEPTRTGKPRAPTTMSSYKRAVEGFVAAMRNVDQTDVSALPETFIEKEWMQTQQSILTQPVQLRVRVIAVKMFTQWLATQGLNVPKFIIPNITTPKPQQKETPMTDLTQLADTATQADPIPSATTYVPPPVQTTIPPPRPERPAPVATKAQMGSNPLSSMMPAPGFKLRVRRDRDADDPVFVDDFPADRVQPFGAIEPFLARVVGPRLAAAGIVGDVPFLISMVAPNGAEGQRTRMTVTISGGVPAAPQTITNGQLTPPTSQAELMETMETYRKMSETLKEQLASSFPQVNTQQMERPVANNAEMDEMRSMMRQLTMTVNNLAEQVQQVRTQPVMREMEMAPMAPQPPAPPQLDMNAVLKTVVDLSARQSTPAQTQQPTSMVELFTMMKTAKEVFAPQNVQIDTSPLEEQIHDMRQQLNAASKKDDLTEMVTKFKMMRELFGMVGGEMSAPKPTLMGSLGNLLDKVVNNPAPLADAVERILGAATAVKTGQPLPERREPEGLPAEVTSATGELLKAEGDKATVLAAHHWLGVMGASGKEQLVKIVQKISGLLKAEDEIALTVYMRQVFRVFGFEAQATNERVSKIVSDILAKVRAAAAANKAAQSGDEGDEEEEQEEDAPADMTIRVGGAHLRALDSEETEEETEDDGGETEVDESEDVEETDESESEPGDEEPSEEELLEEGAIETPVNVEPVEVDPTPEELEAALQEPKRKRRKAKADPALPVVEQHAPAVATTVT